MFDSTLEGVEKVGKPHEKQKDSHAQLAQSTADLVAVPVSDLTDNGSGIQGPEDSRVFLHGGRVQNWRLLSETVSMMLGPPKHSVSKWGLHLMARCLPHTWPLKMQ